MRVVGAPTDVVWRPDPAAATNVGRFADANGLASFDEIVRRSIDEPEWLWDNVEAIRAAR